MKKTKVTGIAIISLAVISITAVISYTALFTIFGIKSGGSILMLIPLLIIASILLLALIGFFYFGVKYIKK